MAGPTLSTVEEVLDEELQQVETVAQPADQGTHQARTGGPWFADLILYS